MGEIRDISTWPSIKQVANQLGMAQAYINKLVRQGTLRSVKTALGALVDPESVKEFAHKRDARLDKSAPKQLLSDELSTAS